MTAHKPMRVLLVDDDEEDYMIARDLFEDIEHGAYALDWVGEYEEALEVIGQRAHDVYLFDYHLGARDGLELLQDALKLGTRAPIIMLTGQGGRDVDVTAMELGAYDYLVKGQITGQVLERALRYAVQHAESTEALRSTVRISSALLAAVNRVEHGVMISDPLQEDEPLIFVNEHFLDMTGYARGDVLGRNARFLQGPETDPAEMQAMRERIAAREPYHGVVTNHRADGSAFRWDLSLYPVFDARDDLVHLVGVCKEPEG